MPLLPRRYHPPPRWPTRNSRFRSSSKGSGPSWTGSVVTFDPDRLRERLAELEQELGQPGFWDDQQHAAAVSAEHARLARRLDRYDRLNREYSDAKELLSLDASLADDVEASIVPLRRELAR